MTRTAAFFKNTYIPCKVADGAFSSEYAVTIQQNNGQDVSLFADRSLVLEEKDHSFLRVTKISIEGSIGVYLLPTETLENGSRWIKLRQEYAIEK